MVVDKMGLPNNVEVFRSLAPKFDKSAIAAVRKYRFSPAMRNGQPVDVSVNVEVHFAKY
jgi:protein TonB